ncbi:TIGR03085 family metal-binding protein [Leekyejoonella antrihumi]|uniref:TIGR03085 family protein n=1 Tax=Leekyejoonella antrihumi TaxID=1660198 RepID=A0A563DTR9_9MICO|nr:TIGR03085 family metal-binding protein [Leekyejoonella antrihumi]TWP33576.1 TIGR03085 family protein [Leekyejoonella antrihumi]
MPRHAQQERSALCDTLSEVGPDAPTLCEGWTTKDLAAHVIIRERRPDAAAGMLLPPLRGHAARVSARLAAQDWAETVSTIRSGPPHWTPFALPMVDEKANLTEFFVHHEDVRRAGDAQQPRELGQDLESALWATLPRIGLLAMRQVRTGVVADSPGFGRRSIRSAKDDHGSVVIGGAPGEILLYVFGRGQVADVTIDGADRDVQAFRATTLGF